MRELKFRIWDKLSKHFLGESDSFHVSSFPVIDLNGKIYSADTPIDPEHGTETTLNGGQNYIWKMRDGVPTVFEDRFVVQQYTGLDDKDETPVYEGDIIEFKYQTGDFAEDDGFEKDIGGKTFRGVVDLWVDDFPYPSIACETELGKMRFGIVEVTNGEIIGNILENGDLLCEN